MISIRFSNTLNVLVAIALADGQPVSSDALSNCIGIHAVGIRRMFRGLAEAGFVTVRTGIHGGAVLSRPASEITLGELYRVVEAAGAPRSTPGACNDHARAHVRALSAQLGRRIQDSIDRELGAVTLADVVAGAREPVCEPALATTAAHRGYM